MTSKIIIAVVIIAVIAAAWMYFSGNLAPQQGPSENASDTQASLPAATGSLDELGAAVNADIQGTASITSADDSAAAAASGNASASNATGAVGSY